MRRARPLALAAATLAVVVPATALVPVPLVKLTPIASLSQPLALATRPGDPAYVAEKVGRVRAIRGGVVDPVPVLDISGEVSNGGEQGLLGLVFSPDGATVYVDWTDRVGIGRSRVTAFEFATGTAGARHEILTVDQPFSNHNGGHLAFGPDGFLYVSIGDGGSGGDPFDNGQRLDTLLGKILRIDPHPGLTPAYDTPPTNPFVGAQGMDEIWAYGLRNPWRFSFDRTTGDLWIGDVGQNAWEEIDRQPGSSGGGQNYGWRRFEGTHRYDTEPEPASHTPPVYEYSHAGGNCSITGGVVYRGARIPALSGAYLFADFCRGRVMALRDLPVLGTVAQDLAIGAAAIASFGEDAAGEVYVLSLNGPVYRLDPLP